MVRLLRAAFFACWLGAATSLAATPNPDLERAEKLVADLEYKQAARALEQALAVPGNDRETLIRIYELKGIVAGSLNQAARAKQAFTLLLSLDPKHAFATRYAPRVTGPYQEAKTWVRQNGALGLEPGPVVKGPNGVESVSVKVSDPMAVGRQVRFAIRGRTGWEAAERPVENGASTMPVEGREVVWYAELLGENDAIVASLGTERAPRTARAAAPKVAEARPAPRPKRDEPLAEIRDDEATASGGSGLKTAGILSLSAAALAAGGGAFFGLQSNRARAEFSAAERDGAGNVTGLTQKRAYELNEQARASATLANILFASSAALAGAGLVMLATGGGDAVAIAPTANGVAVAGSWP